MSKILISTLDSYEVVPLESIYSICIVDEITYVNLENNRISCLDSLGKLETVLNRSSFFRCHKSYIINLNHVIRIGKDGYVELTNNLKVDVARRRMPKLIEILREVIK